jgi:sterol desaturase/sphingolipid hydroxylase (fatty acid hydroxylase superfamily)
VQAVCLPNALKIDLHIIDHHWHHLAFTANYGKRFLLWDKVFGTYSTPENLQYRNDKKFQ